MMVAAENPTDVVRLRDRFRPPTLLQVALLGMAVLMILASLTSGVIASRLDHNIGLLELHETADQMGVAVQPIESYSIASVKDRLGSLRWITYGALGASLVAQYIGLCAVIWFVARIIRRQRHDLEQRVQELTSLNQMFRKYLEEEVEGRTTAHDDREAGDLKDEGSGIGFTGQLSQPGERISAN